jgi:hypothetical protein
MGGTGRIEIKEIDLIIIKVNNEHRRQSNPLIGNLFALGNTANNYRKLLL